MTGLVSSRDVFRKKWVMMQNVTLFFLHRMILFICKIVRHFYKVNLVKTDHPAFTHCWSSRGIQGHWPSSLTWSKVSSTVIKYKNIMFYSLLSCKASSVILGIRVMIIPHAVWEYRIKLIAKLYSIIFL